MKKYKDPFYHFQPLLEKYPDAKYYMAIGERSNGKTFSALEIGLEDYFSKGNKMAYIRRYDEDFKGKRGKELFGNFINNELRGNIIEKMSKGKWNAVIYYSSCWYMAKINPDDPKDRIMDNSPFCYGFALSEMEHDKSSSYPEVTNIAFDEFITRRFYLVDEFVTFTNVLSTIIRNRDNVRIFMCGNTVNQYCIYFKEMGLTHIKSMKKGEIEVYNYGTSGLQVVVEFSDFKEKSKKSDVYFAFNNPKLEMIKSGAWEIAIYPHLTKEMKYKDENIMYKFYISFEGDLMECHIVSLESQSFIFIHQKTTPLREDNVNLVYSTEYDSRPNYRRRINRPVSKIENTIFQMFRNEKVFYQSNDIGEVIRNYLNWCVSFKQT